MIAFFRVLLSDKNHFKKFIWESIESCLRGNFRHSTFITVTHLTWLVCHDINLMTVSSHDVIMIDTLLTQSQFLTCCLASDSRQFRQLIAWLEDQKIRHYKIEDRDSLRNMESQNWQQEFDRVSPEHDNIMITMITVMIVFQYLKQMDCPFSSCQQELVLDWLLTLAVRLEYEDNSMSTLDSHTLQYTSICFILLSLNWCFIDIHTNHTNTKICFINISLSIEYICIYLNALFSNETIFTT